MVSNLCIYCKIMKWFESITSLRFAHASKHVSLLFWCLPENGKDYMGSSVLLKSKLACLHYIGCSETDKAAQQIGILEKGAVSQHGSNVLDHLHISRCGVTFHNHLSGPAKATSSWFSTCKSNYNLTTATRSQTRSMESTPPSGPLGPREKLISRSPHNSCPSRSRIGSNIFSPHCSTASIFSSSSITLFVIYFGSYR